MENAEIYKKAKADIYRKLGKICAIAWAAILVLILAVRLLNHLLSGHIHFGYIINFIWMVPLGNIIYNPLLLVAIIFFWRADKNETPKKKSKWVNFILVYIGFYLLISLLLSFFVAFHRTAQRPMSKRYDEMKATLKAIEPERSYNQGINTFQPASMDLEKSTMGISGEKVEKEE